MQLFFNVMIVKIILNTKNTFCTNKKGVLISKYNVFIARLVSNEVIYKIITKTVNKTIISNVKCVKNLLIIKQIKQCIHV